MSCPLLYLRYHVRQNCLEGKMVLRVLSVDIMHFLVQQIQTYFKLHTLLS